MPGAVLSSLIVTERAFDRPAPFLAEQASLVPDVSAVSTVIPHPDEATMPDSLSATCQLTVTALVYHPFRPNVPVTTNVIDGRVVSFSAGVGVLVGVKVVAGVSVGVGVLVGVNVGVSVLVGVSV